MRGILFKSIAGKQRAESVRKVREQLDAGIDAVWMPVAMHTNTLSKIGGRKSWWDPTAGADKSNDRSPTAQVFADG